MEGESVRCRYTTQEEAEELKRATKEEFGPRVFCHVSPYHFLKPVTQEEIVGTLGLVE